MRYLPGQSTSFIGCQNAMHSAPQSFCATCRSTEHHALPGISGALVARLINIIYCLPIHSATQSWAAACRPNHAIYSATQSWGATCQATPYTRPLNLGALHAGPHNAMAGPKSLVRPVPAHLMSFFGRPRAMHWATQSWCARCRAAQQAGGARGRCSVG